MDDIKIPMKIFQTYEELTEYYKDGVDMELGLYVSEGKLLVGHTPTAYSFNPQYFTDENELMPDYVPESPIDYTITATSNNTTYGYVTGGGTYPQHSEITLNAYAYNGYKFDKWSNGVETSAYTFAVEEDANLVGNFVDNTYTVTTKPSAPGIGTTTGDGVYIAGTSVTVTATPAEGYYFADTWRDEDTLEYVMVGDEYTFTVEKNTNLMAIFAHYRTVSATPNNVDYGSTTGSGNQYKYNDSVTVTATANTGYRFVNWTENGTEVATTPTYQFTVTGDRTLVANFDEAFIPEHEPFYVENTTSNTQTLRIIGVDGKRGYSGGFTVEYSSDKENWTTFGTTSTTALRRTIAPGEKLYLRANTTGWSDSSGEKGYTAITGVSKVGGNIMSLLYGANFTGEETTFPTGSTGYQFAGLFDSNTALENAADLILPAELMDRCYQEMFNGCTSLTTAPDLLQARLAGFSYLKMFYNCTNLNYVKCLLVTGHIGYDNLYWMTNVGASGTFVKAAGVSWPTGADGIPSGWTVEEV